ncbi:MAG: serine O-acetyltransferase, partial [Clostridia bacterium]|nr:serine O-acetyltransferase [Clostridia bacterium]
MFGGLKVSADTEKLKTGGIRLSPADLVDKGKKTASDLCSVAKELRASAGDIKYDIDQIRDRDPAATSTAEVALFYSGFHALSAYRLAHAFNSRGYTLTARAISQGARLITGIEIHPGAEIGKGVFVDHGSGVVIGETSIVGDNCTIYQGATLGGTGKDIGKRHPTLGNNVMVGAGAKILGPINIGDNSKIAAGAVVLRDVPPDCTAVG